MALSTILERLIMGDQAGKAIDLCHCPPSSQYFFWVPNTLNSWESFEAKIFFSIENFHFYFPIDQYKYICLKFKKNKVLLPQISENVSLFIGLLSLYGNNSVYIQECSQWCYSGKSTNWKSFLNSKDKHCICLLPLLIFSNSGYLFDGKKVKLSFNKLFLNVSSCMELEKERLLRSS